MHALGAAAEFSRRLRTAQQEHAEQRGLGAPEVENFLQAMLILGDAAVGAAGRARQAFIVQILERLANFRLAQLQDGIAIVLLSAGVHQRVQRKRVVVGRGDVFLDQGTQHARFDFVEDRDHDGIITRNKQGAFGIASSYLAAGSFSGSFSRRSCRPRATSIRSSSTRRVWVTFFSGMLTILLPCRAAMMPNSPRCTMSIAPMP